MSDLLITIVGILACAASGAVGYIVGQREGDSEGFLNGLLYAMQQTTDFLSLNSGVIRHAVEKQRESEDEDDFPDNDLGI